MSLPLSIVLPTKDRLDLLQCCIASIQPQMLDRDELLVLVDGPEDQSYGYLQDLQTRVSGLRLVHPAGRLGGFSHYRLLFESAHHDHIVMVHDDELYHASLLREVRNSFSCHPSLTFINTGQLVVWAGSKVAIQRNIEFSEERIVPGREWASQEIAKGMKFNCSCLAFRRIPETFEVLTRTQISADNLFVAMLAAKGDILELPIFGSTWLLHSGNTSRRDYLRPGHEALWTSLAELRQRGELAFLSDETLESQKRIAIGIYSWNAFAAAAVDGNADGYRECLRQTRLAGATGLKQTVLCLAGTQLFWPLTCISARIAKKLTANKRSKKDSHPAPEKSLEQSLGLSAPSIFKWLEAVRKIGR